VIRVRNQESDKDANMKRRYFFLTPLLLVAPAARGEVAYPAVVAGTPLVFPRDHGSHPAFRTEWWYITGWVRDATATISASRSRSSATVPAWRKEAQAGSHRPSCCSRTRRSRIRASAACGTISAPRVQAGPCGGE
jgi:hypothetical protein